jgi:signal peptidase I
MPRLFPILAVAAALACVAAGWLFLAPPGLGGRTSYAVVYGTSMEPHFHRGDLVLLRRRPSYRIGEVVAYHSVRLRRDVLHRIVALHGDRFSFRGDNNNFLDPEQPGAAQLFGEEWLRLPGAGAQLERLRSPRNAAIVAGLAALLLFGGSGSTVRRRRGRRREDDEPVGDAAPRWQAPPLGAGVTALGGVVLALSLVLALTAFTRPEIRTLVSPDLYVKRGAFSYTAHVPVGPVYTDRVLHAPTPVYLKLVRGLDVAFAYSTESKRPLQLAGTGRLDAMLGDGSGWSRELPLAPARALAAGRTTLRGRLDLQRLAALVRRFEAQTGEHNTLYKLELRARIELNGTAAGKRVHDVFTPVLTFDLDELRLQVEQPAEGGTRNSLARAEGAQETSREPVSVGAFGRRLTVARARRISLLGAAVGLACLLAGGLLALVRRREDEGVSIARRYGDWIVEIAPGERPAGAERRVASIEALARLAERYERLILHERCERSDAFLVEDDGIVYRYEVERPIDPDDVTLVGWPPEQGVRPLVEERP